MTDHAELRRLAEKATADGLDWYEAEGDEWDKLCNPQTVLALLDAAERADRLAGLVEQARLMEWMQEYAPEWCAEVDRAE